jgi:hypothetical protein
MKVIIRNQTQNILNEIKKNGLIYERSNVFECRVGDCIVLYISKERSKLLPNV